MKATVANRLLAPFFLLCVVCCSRPASYERFIRADEAGDSAYVFQLDLGDTLSKYDVWFYTATDEPVVDTLSGGFRIDATWINPACDSLCETVYMPYGKPDGYKVLYRSGLVPAVPGIWTLEAVLSEAPADIRGLGVICERKDGTR